MSDINSQLRQTPIAVIGLGAIMPEAHNVREFWNNIIGKVDCITDVPVSRWDIEDYYDPDPSAPDKTYCKRGGFLPEVDFDPLEFGLPPNILEVTDVSQMLSLLVAKEALSDAGDQTPPGVNPELTSGELHALRNLARKQSGQSVPFVNIADARRHEDDING